MVYRLTYKHLTYVTYSRSATQSSVILASKISSIPYCDNRAVKKNLNRFLEPILPLDNAGRSEKSNHYQILLSKRSNISWCNTFYFAKAFEKATSWLRFILPPANWPCLSFVGFFFNLPHFFSAMAMLSTANLACSLASELTALSFSAARNCSFNACHLPKGSPKESTMQL